MNDDRWGPLSGWVGCWEGQQGLDVSPSDDRGIERNVFREVTRFEPLSPVQNHEQEMYGLRYITTATRLGEKDPFHEDMGYWLWDAKASFLIKSFTVPRGIALIAGGRVDARATRFELRAQEDSRVCGVVQNPFLEKEFRITRFDLRIDVQPGRSFSYEQTTFMHMKGRPEPFLHTDRNILFKVA